MSRRDALLAGSGAILGTLISPKAATAGTANPFMEEEINFEPSQMPRGDKIDINGAFVVSEMILKTRIYLNALAIEKDFFISYK